MLFGFTSFSVINYFCACQTPAKFKGHPEKLFSVQNVLLGKQGFLHGLSTSLHICIMAT